MTEHLTEAPPPYEVAACPRATLVTTWFQGERLAGDLALPMERCRWVKPEAVLPGQSMLDQLLAQTMPRRA